MNTNAFLEATEEADLNRYSRGLRYSHDHPHPRLSNRLSNPPPEQCLANQPFDCVFRKELRANF